MNRTITYFDLVGDYCARYGVIFDTSVLLALCIGKYNSSRISTFKKTAVYTIDDYMFLHRVSERFNPLYITPQVLAELSNHSDMLPIREIHEYYGSIKDYLLSQYEAYFHKDVLINDQYLPELGFADISIYQTCLDKKCVLFTADRKLTQICRHNNIQVFNFNEYRDQL